MKIFDISWKADDKSSSAIISWPILILQVINGFCRVEALGQAMKPSKRQCLKSNLLSTPPEFHFYLKVERERERAQNARKL